MFRCWVGYGETDSCQPVMDILYICPDLLVSGPMNEWLQMQTLAPGGRPQAAISSAAFTALPG